MSEIWKYFRRLFPLEAEKLEFYIENVNYNAEKTAKMQK